MTVKSTVFHTNIRTTVYESSADEGADGGSRLWPHRVAFNVHICSH